MTVGTTWMIAGAIFMLAAYWQWKANHPGLMAMNIAAGALNIAVGVARYAAP